MGLRWQIAMYLAVLVGLSAVVIAVGLAPIFGAQWFEHGWIYMSWVIGGMLTLIGYVVAGTWWSDRKMAALFRQDFETQLQRLKSDYETAVLRRAKRHHGEQTNE